MSFGDGSHGTIAGVRFKLDQAAPDEIQRPAYRHFARSLFRPGTDITGRPGAQNIREERMLWHQTDWSGGEGQVILDGSDDDSARRFYRSEGLDFSVPGQVSLNKSSIATVPPDGTAGGTSTIQGNSFTDVTGTSTTVNTNDRRINLTTPDVIESASFTPGAGVTSATLYAYKEALQTTTIEGSSFLLKDGDGDASGTDFRLKSVGSMAQSTSLTSLGTSPYTVTFNVNATASTTQYAAEVKLLIVDTTGNNDDVVASEVISVPNVTQKSITFTPSNSKTYRARVRWLSKTGSTQRVTIDSITHGLAGQPTSVTVFVRNHTDGNTTNLPSHTIQLQNSSTAAAVTLQWTATAAKAYRVRVQYNSGPQRPVVDKLEHAVQTTGTGWILPEMAKGLEDKVWLAGYRSGNDAQTWSYTVGTDVWTLEEDLAAVTATQPFPGLVCTSKFMYLNFASEAANFTGSSEDNYANPPATHVQDMTIAQNRLFMLKESTGAAAVIYAFPLDQDVSGGALTSGSSGYATAAVADYLNPLASGAGSYVYPQRMASSATGAKFFVSLAGVQPVIYEVNNATGTLVVTSWAHLPFGVQATAITHVSGVTFVAGQYTAESDETPITALWAIDENREVTRVAILRQDDPYVEPIIQMEPWQNDIWMLQGKYMWRYSLQTGGIFCEYELNPEDASYAYGLTVMSGRQWALYQQSSATNVGGVVHVTGTVDTYRQATVVGGCAYTSSVYDYNLPGVTKMLRRIQVVTDDLPADTSISVEYQVNQDGTWLPAGEHVTGAETTIIVSDASTLVEFRTLQLRVTLNSATGTSTPTLKAVIVESLPSEYEEFFDLMVLTEHEDSGFHVDGLQREGGDISSALFGLWRTGQPATFVDGFAYDRVGFNPEYLVRVEDVDASNDEIGEGRMSVRLRVLA